MFVCSFCPWQNVTQIYFINHSFMFEIYSFFAFVHFFALQNNSPTVKFIRIITELAVSDFGSSAFQSFYLLVLPPLPNCHYGRLVWSCYFLTLFFLFIKVLKQGRGIASWNSCSSSACWAGADDGLIIFQGCWQI